MPEDLYNYLVRISVDMEIKYTATGLGMCAGTAERNRRAKMVEETMTD